MDISISSGSAVAGLIAQQQGGAQGAAAANSPDAAAAVSKRALVSGGLAANQDFQSTLQSASVTGKGGTVNTLV